MTTKKSTILNSKGLSSAVAAVIIATISVALVGTTYFFSRGMIESATAETFELIDMFGNKIIIKNLGTQPISNFRILIDGNEVENTIEGGSIEPGKIGTIVLTNLEGIQPGIHQLTIVSRSMSQTWQWQFNYVTTSVSTTTIAETTTESTTSTTTTILEEGQTKQSIELSVKSQQGKAEIGKPVKWTSQIEINNPSNVDITNYLVNLTIPKDAENVAIRDSTERILTMNENSLKVNVTEKTYASYSAEYETPAPYKEEINESKDWKKLIKVKSDATVHYMNVSVDSEISENIVPRIYLIQGDTKIDITYNSSYNVSLIDSNSNGRVDTISWIVPELSEKLFGILDVGSWLNVSLLTPNPSLCNETYPCSWSQNSNQWVNATVECKNANCGNVSGTVKYNNSATTWSLVSTQSGDQPFYITSGGSGATISPDSTWYNATKNLPPSALGSSMAYFAAFDKTVRFGGTTKSTSGIVSNQTWIYNHTDNTWYNATRNDGNGPVARWQRPAMAYDNSHSRIIMYGGYSGSARLSDTWEYNMGGNTWNNMNPSSNPGARSYAGLVYDSKNDRLIFFGGTSTGSDYKQDTWIYNYSSNTWHQIPTSNPAPSAREEHSMVYDKSCKLTVMFGGVGGCGVGTTGKCNDTWVFNYTDSTWYQVAKKGAYTPPNMTDPAMFFSDSLNKTVLFGGVTSAGTIDDIWVFNCSDYKWYNVTNDIGGTPPQARSNMGFVYNANSTNMMIHAGSIGTGTYYALNDTWLLNYTPGGSGLTNIQLCGNLIIGQKCQLNWTLKITDSSENPYKINANFSTDDKYAQNETNNATIKTELPDITSPRWYDNSTNNTRAGLLTEFDLRWTDNKGLSGYVFSLDNCTGEFKNDTDEWKKMSGIGNWSNVTKYINSTDNCPLRWKIFANDTSNNWNVSNIFSFNTANGPGWFNTILIEPSPILCNNTYPCEKILYRNFIVSAKVECKRSDCGNVNGSIEYNSSSPIPDAPISTVPWTLPLYVASDNLHAISYTSDYPISGEPVEYPENASDNDFNDTSTYAHIHAVSYSGDPPMDTGSITYEWNFNGTYPGATLFYTWTTIIRRILSANREINIYLYDWNTQAFDEKIHSVTNQSGTFSLDLTSEYINSTGGIKVKFEAVAGSTMGTFADAEIYLNDTYITTKAQNMLTCGNVNKDQTCQLNWTVRTTGPINSAYKIGVKFNSSYSEIKDNHTDNATIKIVRAYLKSILDKPIPNIITNINRYDLFNVSAYAKCNTTDCGIVYGTVRYNKSLTIPDTTITNLDSEKPFYVVPWVRPVDYNITLNGGSVLSPLNAFDNGYNDTNTSARIVAGPYLGPTSAEYIFSLGKARYGTLYITANHSSDLGGGVLQVYRFIPTGSWVTIAPVSETLQTYSYLVNVSNGYVNSTGHVRIRALSSGSETGEEVLLFDTYITTINNPVYCGYMKKDDLCILNLTLNATGNVNDVRKIDINFTSSDIYLWNDTDDAIIKIIDNQKPIFSSNSTNSTIIMLPIKFSLRWSDDGGLDSYKFYLDNCTGGFVKMTEKKFPSGAGTYNDWSNETAYVANFSSVGCTVRWLYEANDTTGNKINSSTYSFNTAFAYITSYLMMPDPDVCTDDNPCMERQNVNFTIMGNTTCTLVPAGYDCGHILAYLRYNKTGSEPRELVNATESLSSTVYFNETMLPTNNMSLGYKISSSQYSLPDYANVPLTDDEYVYVNSTGGGTLDTTSNSSLVCTGSVCDYDTSEECGACSLCTWDWDEYCKPRNYLTRCSNYNPPCPCSCYSTLSEVFVHHRFDFNISTIPINKITNISFTYAGYYENIGDNTSAYLQFKNVSTSWTRYAYLTNTLTNYNIIFNSSFSSLISNGIIKFAATGDAYAGSNMTLRTDFAKLIVTYKRDNPQPCGVDALTQGDTCIVQWVITPTSLPGTSWKMDINFTSQEYNVTDDTNNTVIKIVESNPPKYWNNSTNSTSAGHVVKFNLNWTDDTGLSGYIFSLDNCTGEFKNDTVDWQPLSGKTAWTNISEVVNSSLGCSIRWKFYAVDVFGNLNESIPFQFYTTNQPPAVPTIMNPVKGQWFNENTINPYTFSCNSTDPDTDPISYNISWCEQLQSCSYKIICSADSDGNCGDNYDWRSNMPDDDNITIRCEAYDGKQMSSFGYTWFKKDVTDPTCILNITDGAILISNYRINGTYWDAFNVSNVTYFYFNESTKNWDFIGTNSTYPDFTMGWNVPSILEGNTNVTLRAICNDTAGNSANDTRMGIIVDTVNQKPRIWNLWIRDYNDFIISETMTGVNVYFTVNVTDSDPYRNISYIQGNFTLPNGTSVYKNFTMSPAGKQYTHNWTYVIPYNAKNSPPNATINVTAYDRDKAWNATNRSLWIRKTVEFVLYNAPINFSLAYPLQKVTAMTGQGWPLYAAMEGNVKMNLTQKAKEDLIGMVIQNEKIGIRNVTWNVNTTGPFSQLVATDYLIINRSVTPGFDQPIYYKLDVPSITPQKYGGQVDIYGNCSNDVSCQEEYP